MKNDEVVNVLISELPVIYNDPKHGKIEYDKVNAVIYKKINKKITVCLELLDKNKNSVTTVRAIYVDCPKLKNQNN